MNLNPLEQIHPWVMVAVAAIFTLTYFALRRVYVLPYLHVMEEREQLLSESDARRADAERMRREADEEASGIVADARGRAEGLVKTARAEADEYRSTRIGSVNAEASERLVAGRTKIASDHEAALQVLREQAIECVVVACERLIGTIAREEAEGAVDEALGRLGR